MYYSHCVLILLEQIPIHRLLFLFVMYFIVYPLRARVSNLAIVNITCACAKWVVWVAQREDPWLLPCLGLGTMYVCEMMT